MNKSLLRAKTAAPQYGYLHAQTEQGPKGCRLVRPRRFEVTDLGVGIWKQVREFYALGEGPPADLTPIFPDEGRLARLPREARRALLRRRRGRQVKRILERFLGQSLDGI